MASAAAIATKSPMCRRQRAPIGAGPKSSSASASSALSSANRSPARAENRRFWLLSALWTHTNAPYKTALLWKTLRALNRPGRARTEPRGPEGRGEGRPAGAALEVEARGAGLDGRAENGVRLPLVHPLFHTKFS